MLCLSFILILDKLFWLLYEKKPILEGNLFLQKKHFRRNWLLIRFELTFLDLDNDPEQKALARSSLLGSDVLDYRQGWATKITTKKTRPAWAGFKTAEEGRAKICKFLWQKLKNKSNVEKHIMNNFKTLLELF